MNKTTSSDRFLEHVTRLTPMGAATVLGAYGLLGFLASGLVITMAVTGLFLHLSYKARFNAPGPVKTWAAIILIYVLVGLGLLFLHHVSDQPVDKELNRMSFLTFLPLTALFFIPDPEDLINTVKDGAAMGSLVIFVAAMVEYFFIHDRVWLAAGNQGPFSVVTAVSFSLCTFAAITGNPGKRRQLYILASVAAAACILLSGMRSMLPALLLVPLLGIMLLKPARWGTLSVSRILVIVMTLTIVLMVAGWFTMPRFEALLVNWEKASLTQNYDTSLGRRIVMWDYALQQIPSHPWLGIGYREMVSGLSRFSQAEYGFQLNKTHLHNFALTALVQGGLVELASLLALICAPLLLLKSPHRDHTARFGLVFMLAVSIIYLMSGTLNIMFSHDIMDLMYITCAAFSIAVVFRDRPVRS